MTTKKTRGSEWFTPAEIAAELGYSRTWVRQQIDAGHLEALQHQGSRRRSFRVHRASLQRFIDNFMTPLDAM